MAKEILGTKVYYDEDCDMGFLKGKKITVLGYGSQGHAHALNLKDSGFEVTVGLRKESAAWSVAEKDGFQVKITGEAVRDADVVMVLIPDEVQGEIYTQDIAPNLKEGAYLGFGHGFCIQFKKIIPAPSTNVFMVAPKSPGHLARRTFCQGSGVPALVAVHQDPAGDTEKVALAWACGIGSGRSGILPTTFIQETETDLFGEQAVLCGGITALMQTGFEVLTEAGYDPVSAYFECLHEMKLIVDLIYEGGFSKMRHSVSNTAEYGDYKIGPRIITPAVKEEMKKILAEIKSGEFANEFYDDRAKTQAYLKEQRAKSEELPIEKVGKELRELMSWIPKE